MGRRPDSTHIITIRFMGAINAFSPDPPSGLKVKYLLCVLVLLVLVVVVVLGRFPDGWYQANLPPFAFFVQPSSILAKRLPSLTDDEGRRRL
jgi:hypothetical protein